MDRYVTGAMIKRLRESAGMTQLQLAERIDVGDKAVSRWECGRGYPDVTLLEPLAAALGVSVVELMAGTDVRNANRSSNMLRSRLYVCPVCGNALHAMGEAVVSCCGISLPPLEADAAEGEHAIKVEVVEDELYVSLEHPMDKGHHVSFLAAVSPDRVQLVKLYPEGDAAARFRRAGVRDVFAYCNRHGLFQVACAKSLQRRHAGR
ncbi:helix-turn-helix domain-containing protein [Xiamenia xianingshaonis]|uniref:Helix-turn-helix domain-containing protein n=1 Tax=Xiamenia xianingshaonis TaxID=2682776 RepID=A0ABX0ILB1_9ACTN|nr:helix-turn-helix domain-containing protein [Xiamenia xianingshaonis]NHM13637.1 helix-turn-helix domain-containing protein [Xiamenia xianingshaonis]